tara:strand:- start:635 stop:877 length:243 start_codon:yes stop_codon:yes gene_type:complete
MGRVLDAPETSSGVNPLVHRLLVAENESLKQRVDLASVLFFAGISTVLQTHRVRLALLVSGAALWIGAVSYLATLPIASL